MVRQRGWDQDDVFVDFIVDVARHPADAIPVVNISAAIVAHTSVADRATTDENPPGSGNGVSIDVHCLPSQYPATATGAPGSSYEPPTVHISLAETTERLTNAG
jgi:hypothetical protein